MTMFREVMDLVGTAVDTAGVAVMVFGATIATVRFLFTKQGRTVNAYRLCRQDMGRAILLGARISCCGRHHTDGRC